MLDYPVLTQRGFHFYRIPTHLLTQRNWDRIIGICAANANEPDHGLAALNRHIDMLIGYVPAERHVTAPINHQQSTHTASVHTSVSQSAIRLRERYLQTFNVHSVLKEIKTYINQQNKGLLKNQVVTRCVQRLTASAYVFTDPQSKVNTAQIMCLSWRAIHDDSLRIGTLDNARDAFIEGLYEMQREYNINRHGIDDESKVDRPSCMAGTFNKFIEKLVGHHPDATICMITLAQASTKFPIVVQTVTREYLNDQKDKCTANAFSALLDQLSESEFSSIWNKIKDSVVTKIMDEFGVLYQNDSKNTYFCALLSAYEYMDLSELINNYRQSTAMSLQGNAPFFKPAPERCNDSEMTENNVPVPEL